MSTDTHALVAFLRARLDDDERVARAASDLGASWYVDGRTGEVAAVQPNPEPGDSAVLITCDSEGLSASVGEERAVHIARHDPARVLREVEAKRRMLTECIPELGGMSPHQVGYEEIVRLLALPYAKHPEYRVEWAP